MKQKELYELREKPSKNFNKISNLRIFLENLLGENLIFPLVVGYEDMDKKHWQIKNLSPLSNSTILTIQNYLEAIKNLEQKKESKIFKGGIVYNGLDIFHHSQKDTFILGAGITQEKTKQALQSFDLEIYLGYSGYDLLETNKVGYNAISKISPTRLEQVCNRFVGPNFDIKHL